MPRTAELIQLDVVAGVLRDDTGRVLLAQRPEGKAQAGFWEFPGGKRAPGETYGEALARELREELGIGVSQVSPLMQLHHRYPDREISLSIWEVTGWDGVPAGLEGQSLRWVSRGELRNPAALGLEVLAANTPILAAAMLPARYLITPPDVHGDILSTMFERAMASGIRLLQIRRPRATAGELENLARAAASCAARLESAPEWLLGGGDPAQTVPLALRFGAAGIHVPSRYLGGLPAVRAALGPGPWLLASCHDAQGLSLARTGGADAAVLGPVCPTASHPGDDVLGWERFTELTRDLPLPVFAIGGLDDGDVGAARRAGAQGIAGIRSVGTGSPPVS